MNKILKLFDQKYVTDLLAKEVLPLYPDFKSIKSIDIHAYKDNIWEGSYHVVIEYSTKFLTATGKVKKLPIFCSAHSDEPRKNVYDGLKFLWEHGFAKGYLTIPHPLFYSKYFQGTFYRGVEGAHLYQFIKQQDLDVIEKIVPKAAQWFAKLHALPTEQAKNFNKENSRIATVFPGIPHILTRVKRDYPDYEAVYQEIYDILDSQERLFLDSTSQRWLVHGDAHPENVIKMGERKLAVIDFTDLCLADFARDLGAFLQQLEFMIKRKIKDANYAAKIKKLFLDSYFERSSLEFDPSIQSRINNYYYWTMMRTATHFFIKDKPEPERAYPLICNVCQGLALKTDYKNIC